MKNDFLGKIRQLFLQKESFVICILAGILLLVIVWPMEDGAKKDNKEEGELLDGSQAIIDYEHEVKLMEEDKATEVFQYQEDNELYPPTLIAMEKKLEELLSMIEGVGKAKVMITLDSLGEKVLEKDIPVERSMITETDSEGGSRSTNNENSKEVTVYVTDSQGNKIPYVITQTLPAVRGVTVVCQGGDADYIQKNITEVIQALFGIEVHKIKIVKMKQME